MATQRNKLAMLGRIKALIGKYERLAEQGDLTAVKVVVDLQRAIEPEDTGHGPDD